MEQFKQFNLEKQRTIDTLEHLRGILVELQELGMDVNEDFKKIESAVEAVESDVLRIALLGAFSDGKTSVVAAWMGKVLEDMKIDMDESSDRLAIYKPQGLPDQCEIVDTPGLFGDKEKSVEGNKIMYEDMTKRYISEAHLIFYVVDATNPLKESHNDIAKWVLRDLNKLSSTIFIINKMDEVTDLTDETLFDHQSIIKKENLKAKLQRIANLAPNELEKLSIICMASNPNGRGLDFWFNKPEHYESRSRIGDLKIATNKILTKNVPAVLIAKTGIDVVRGVVAKKVNAADFQLLELESYQQQNLEESHRIQADIARGEKDVKELAKQLFTELDTIENQLISKLRPLELEGSDIRTFLEDEIGYNQDNVGYKLGLRIKYIVDSYFEQSSTITSRTVQDISSQLDSTQSFIAAMSDSALRNAGNAIKGVAFIDVNTVKAAVFTGRDLLSKAGYVYKFKPWEATKLAGNITKWAGPAGAAVTLVADLYQAYSAHEKEQELKKVKEDITNLIKNSFKDIYDILSDDQKTLQFFSPELEQLKTVVADVEQNKILLQTRKQKVESIKGKLNNLTLLGDSSTK